MSTAQHALGVIGAGVLAFGAVFTAYSVAPPVDDSSASTSEHGTEHESGTPTPGPTEPDTTVPEEHAVVGLWREADPSANQDAFVEFKEDGTWEASDGCNGASGEWTLGLDGEFDSGEPGPMTLIACDNSMIPIRVWDAVSVENDGSEHLVLIGEDESRFELVKSE